MLPLAPVPGGGWQQLQTNCVVLTGSLGCRKRPPMAACVGGDGASVPASTLPAQPALASA